MCGVLGAWVLGWKLGQGAPCLGTGWEANRKETRNKSTVVFQVSEITVRLTVRLSDTNKRTIVMGISDTSV